VESDAARVESKAVQIYSDTTVIASQAAVIKSDAALLEAASAEPTGVPAANASPLTKLGVLFMIARNKKTVTATKKTYHDDAGVAAFEADLTDDNVTYEESELNAV
jgi:hypothetical protein